MGKRYTLCALLFLTLFIVFLTILSIMLWDNPYSLIYKWRTFDRDTLVAEVLANNEKHYQEALKNLTMVGQRKNTNNDITKDIVIGIITVSRSYKSKLLGYLTQVAYSLHKSVSEENVEVVICNTERDPARHTEVASIANLFHVYNRFSEGPDPNMKKDLIGWTARENGYAKEKEDYIFCLQKLLEHPSEYLIVLEDDALPIERFYSELRSYVLPRLNYYYSKWGYAKLYYPPKWQGYAYEWPRILDLVHTAFFGAVIVFIVYTISRIICKHQKAVRTMYLRKVLSALDKRKLLLISVLGFVASLSFAVVIGRQNVLEIQRFFHYYSFPTSPGCCTPGILYKSDCAQNMVRYFQNVTCNSKYPFDIALQDFTRTSNIEAYLVEPNLLNHIGLVSAIEGKGLKADLGEFL